MELDNISAVDPIVALYDGIIRFLEKAKEATIAGDVIGRRAAVKRALDIIIHLQARLRMDVGRKPAEVLSEYYASIFAEILQASQHESAAKFDSAIKHISDVRGAWKQIATV
jgi:flagellar protein FliS